MPCPVQSSPGHLWGISAKKRCGRANWESSYGQAWSDPTEPRGGTTWSGSQTARLPPRTLRSSELLRRGSELLSRHTPNPPSKARGVTSTKPLAGRSTDRLASAPACRAAAPASIRFHAGSTTWRPKRPQLIMSASQPIGEPAWSAKENFEPIAITRRSMGVESEAGGTSVGDRQGSTTRYSAPGRSHAPPNTARPLQNALAWASQQDGGRAAVPTMAPRRFYKKWKQHAHSGSP